MELIQMFVVLWAMVATSSASIVSVPGLGKIKGTTGKTTWTDRKFQSFYSVGFGKSTSGIRRFMPPEPVEPWSGEYDATTPRRSCPELNIPSKEKPGVDLEDCLTMNIFTPKIPDASKDNKLLPVMVYIHGGGFFEGSSQYFPPNYLLEKDIVLVIPQYRLGPLGFMSLEIDDIAGNVGLMDQVLALEWVNKHIGSFGGDKKRVTIFGQSAGAASVSLLLVSPMVNEDLFQQAILLSGSAYSTWAVNDVNNKYFPKLLFSKLSNKTEEVSDVVMAQYFKNATVPELYAATERAVAADNSGGITRFSAVIQKAGKKKFIDKHPEAFVHSGKFRTVPMIAGVTKNDGSFILPIIYDLCENIGTVNDPKFLKHNLTSLTLKLLDVQDKSSVIASTFEDKYFKELFDSGKDVCFSDISPGTTDIVSIVTFKAPTFRQAKINSQYSPTFFYTFDYQGEHTRFGFGADTTKYPFKGGVHHSDDLLYLFPYPYTTPLNENDTNFAKIIVDFWTSFAIEGKPTSKMAVTWTPKIKGSNGPYIHLQSTPCMSDNFVHNEYDITTREHKLAGKKTCL